MKWLAAEVDRVRTSSLPAGRADFAPMPPGAAALFRREGDYWTRVRRAASSAERARLAVTKATRGRG